MDETRRALECHVSRVHTRRGYDDRDWLSVAVMGRGFDRLDFRGLGLNYVRVARLCAEQTNESGYCRVSNMRLGRAVMRKLVESSRLD